ncbi:uncharacterized protein E0L32_011810 [Thyridium curvatum]|uniref:F-box domain-containing protein n=1 Tax=Thyridium curvatum TaxID=1093900 RepID=A0A507B7L0_9PEZI|nr:uncharacterized protein E0L32_011810 [Thyridium curvatum]TPX18312.1 hypothetical protein E0L32_011810 [Thyridium curvatum]
MDRPMDRLPPEVISLICSQLCFHCCYPDTMPNDDDTAIQKRKTALARFTRTSRRIEIIARPILYHYFSAGSYPEGPRSTIFEGFVDTLIRHPHLAEYVQTLQLQCPGVQVHDNHQLDHGNHQLDHGNYQLNQIDQQQSERLRDELGITWKLADVRNGLLPRLGYYTYSHILRRRWLEEICILLAPNLEALYLKRSAGLTFAQLAESISNLRASGREPRALSKLRTFMLHEDFYDPGSFEAYSDFLLNVPSLETFYYLPGHTGRSLGGNSLSHQSKFDQVYAGHTLGAVKTLMLTAPVVGFLQRILPLFPNLEELGINWAQPEIDYPALAALASPTRIKTLRTCSLTMGFMTASGRVTRPYEYRLGRDRYETLPPDALTAFENLEDLTLDQAAFHYGGAEDPPPPQGGATAAPASQADKTDKDQRLVDVLPSSLRHLRVTCVYRTMLNDLGQLAGVHQERFPALRTVTLGFVDVMEEYRREEIMIMREWAADLFEDTSVILFLGPVSWGNEDESGSEEL